MAGYWEQESLTDYDILLIGGGITGLSAAVSIKERKPAWRVAVLERGIIPAGASTRNAGFACIGSFTELLDDLQHLPGEKVWQLVRMRRDGLQLLRKRLGDAAIGYKENGSYELIGEADLPLLDRLEEINASLYPVLQGRAFSLHDKKIGEFGFDRGMVKALVQNHFEGELHTGKMMQCLIRRAMEAGVEIKTGCRVAAVADKGGGVDVSVFDPVSGRHITLHAGRAGLCTNAFTGELLPGIAVSPGRGQVLITDPVPDLPFRGIFHFDKGYYYFREIEGRVLLGGGRNLDFKTETTTEMALNDHIQRDLEEKLKTMILPGQDIGIAGRWSGIMAFGEDKFPVIKKYSDHIYLGVRLGGMGIAVGSRVGEQLAAMMADGDRRPARL